MLPPPFFLLNGAKRLRAAATLALLMLSAACAGEDRGLPGQSDPLGDAPNCEGQKTNVDALISEGKWPFVLGYVESVEPVLDVILRAGEDHVTSTRCEKLDSARPAIRVKLRVESASWDEHSEGDTITLGIGSGAWLGYDAVPILGQKGQLKWSDGHQYFHQGMRVLAIGGLLPSGELFVLPNSLFDVTGSDTVEDYQQAHCVDGTLNGSDVYELIHEANDATRGETPVMRGTTDQLLATICYD